MEAFRNHIIGKNEFSTLIVKSKTNQDLSWIWVQSSSFLTCGIHFLCFVCTKSNTSILNAKIGLSLLDHSIPLGSMCISASRGSLLFCSKDHCFCWGHCSNVIIVWTVQLDHDWLYFSKHCIHSHYIYSSTNQKHLHSTMTVRYFLNQ